MDPAVHHEVHRRLDAIEREENVRIVYACESGSRAWGFASSDSDYDVRFLYVRPVDDYLSVAVELARDVIERPIVDVFDVNGWDLRKALLLYRKSNPPLLEWLGSPIVYRVRTPAAAELRALVAEQHSPLACAYHYLHMARGNFRDFLRGPEVKTKKYLYVLRPLLAIQWIERDLGVVPTTFQTLVDRLVSPGPLRDAIDDLLARKRAGPELGSGARIEPISAFIESELARHEGGLSARRVPPPSIESIDRVFRATLRAAWA